jgi:hypothetical protein
VATSNIHVCVSYGVGIFRKQDGAQGMVIIIGTPGCSIGGNHVYRSASSIAVSIPDLFNFYGIFAAIDHNRHSKI